MPWPSPERPTRARHEQTVQLMAEAAAKRSRACPSDTCAHKQRALELQRCALFVSKATLSRAAFSILNAWLVRPVKRTSVRPVERNCCRSPNPYGDRYPPGYTPIFPRLATANGQKLRGASCGARRPF